MLPQQKINRKGGYLCPDNNFEQIAENKAPGGFQPAQRADAGSRENMNQRETNGLVIDSRVNCNIEILDYLDLNPTQAVNSLTSYKPKKPENFSEILANADGELEAWPVILQTLRAIVSRPVFTTWIEPTRFESLANGTLTLSVETEFCRKIISKRYRDNLEAAAELVLGEPTRLRLLVDGTMSTAIRHEDNQQAVELPPCPNAADNDKYPLARFQNPKNNPEVAALLEKYGDILGVMKNHPFFKRIQRPEAEGGWNTGLGGLISLAKEYTLEQVLWAAKQANQYQGVHTSRGAIFNHIVRNGMEGLK